MPTPPRVRRGTPPALVVLAAPATPQNRHRLHAEGKPLPGTAAVTTSRPPPGRRQACTLTAANGLLPDGLDPLDQTRDHLDGNAALWDVPNEDPVGPDGKKNKLFMIGNPSSLAACDHGMSIELWATMLTLLSPEQFPPENLPALPFPSTAVTHDDQLHEMILRHDAGLSLWNREDAYRPCDPNAHPHLDEGASKQKDRRGKLILNDGTAEEDEEAELDALYYEQMVRPFAAARAAGKGATSCLLS